MSNDLNQILEEFRARFPGFELLMVIAKPDPAGVKIWLRHTGILVLATAGKMINDALEQRMEADPPPAGDVH